MPAAARSKLCSSVLAWLGVFASLKVKNSTISNYSIQATKLNGSKYWYVS